MSPSRWSQALDTTIEQVFRQRDPDGALFVDVVDGAVPIPSGWEVVERYAALPSPSRARYLVPLGSPRAARACVAGYGRLRSARQRVARQGLGEVVARLPRSLEGGQLLVVRRPDHAGDDVLLSGRLGAALGAPQIQLGIPVRSLDPHSKPTVQLVTPKGVTLGFAKVGATASARVRVSREAQAYQALAGRVAEPVRLATVLDEGTWRGRRILTTSPMSPTARLVHGREYESTFARLRSLSDSECFLPLTSSPTTTELARRLGELSAPAPLAADLAAAIDALLDHHGGVGLGHGTLHGDWVPWNLAVDDGELWAWDLEHWSPCAPVGLDVVLGLTQAAVHGHRMPIAAAMDAIAARAGEQLGLLGLAWEARHALLDLGRIEVAMRAAELLSPGGGWQTGIDGPGFAELLDTVIGGPRRDTGT